MTNEKNYRVFIKRGYGQKDHINSFYCLSDAINFVKDKHIDNIAYINSTKDIYSFERFSLFQCKNLICNCLFL